LKVWPFVLQFVVSFYSQLSRQCPADKKKASELTQALDLIGGDTGNRTWNLGVMNQTMNLLINNIIDLYRLPNSITAWNNSNQRKSPLKMLQNR
jgi:hypothetical protein